MKVKKTKWGKVDQKDVFRFEIRSTENNVVELTNYGASIITISVRDKRGLIEPVILGFNDLKGYVNDTCYMGSTIGRVANRIRGAKFKLGNRLFQLPVNDGNNTNHGGPDGFHAKVFESSYKGNSVLFKSRSEKDEGGFPGELEISVQYTFTDDNKLLIEYNARSTEDTIVNLTNHAYFNLSAGIGNIMEHSLSIPARKILESDRRHLPTGRQIAAADKTFSGDLIKDKLNHDGEVIKGINTYYILDKKKRASDLQLAAILDCPATGRRLNVFTSYPGLVVYTGDFLTSKYKGWFSKNYQAFDGICLECQHYPDAPNQPDFPSITLKAGTLYAEKIMYEFSLIDK